MITSFGHIFDFPKFSRGQTLEKKKQLSQEFKSHPPLCKQNVYMDMMYINI